ncbi:gypsy retrotransposon integrase 1-like protein [Labeo rohita]|uniref:Gypsy retrotransposon integrase 1-like protein n=1 Tax=Labeo rohita TaxID=84645 RepID=A0A498M4J3_LABRO|nr:gypsy retrotransposon integrase 1-like protein [Labeo rohita]RXN15471.1 gypsy retrotransposon integrase 1-like protein [Labeo rohita]
MLLRSEQPFNKRKGEEACGPTHPYYLAPEANQIFVEFHASLYGAHCGTEKTKLAISSRFYWPGMGVDIDKWVLQCADCQFSRLSIKQEPKYIPICVTKPLELLGMDLVGKVTRTRKGNEYICVLVDYYTKWAEAYAIPNKSAAVVSRCIINFFYRFGAPKRILTDQGSEFVNQALYPCEMPETFEINSTVESVIAENTVSEAISLKEKMDHIVKENVGKKQERRHRVATQAPFSVGQKVLRKNIRTQQRKGGKLERSWLGPYEIIFLKDKSADLRDEKGDIYPKINSDHLKLFKEETPRVPHRLLLDEPQLKRPHQETSPSPVDIITKEEQPPPSPPSSPTAPKPSPCVSPKSSTSLSPLDLSLPLSSPVSHPTTLPTVIPADAKDAVHSYIKSAWAGNDSVVLLSKVGPHKLFYQDILQVINAYLMLKVRQHNLTSPEKAFHMDTFAITSVWNGKYQGLKVNPANYDVIVGIVNECHHRYLIVNHSMRLSQKPLQPWVILTACGEVESAHCSCMAGVAEKCAHVAALLYKIDTAVRLQGNVTPTDVEAYWVMPSNITKVQGVPGHTIDFTTSSARKKTLDRSVCGDTSTAPKIRTRSGGTCLPQKTLADLKPLTDLMHAHRSGLCSVMEEFCHLYADPIQPCVLPKSLLRLREPRMDGCDLSVLLQHCEGLTHLVAVTATETAALEKNTRQQHKSDIWHSTRAGRITASIMHAVVSTSITRPAKSTVEKVC